MFDIRHADFSNPKLQRDLEQSMLSDCLCQIDRFNSFERKLLNSFKKVKGTLSDKQFNVLDKLWCKV